MRQIPFSFHVADILIVVQVEVDLRIEIVRVDELIELLVAERDIEGGIVGYRHRIADIVDDLEFVGVGGVREFLHFGGREQQNIVILNDLLFDDRLAEQAVAKLTGWGKSNV